MLSVNHILRIIIQTQGKVGSSGGGEEPGPC